MRWVLGFLAIAALGTVTGVAISNATKDEVPPQVYIEVPAEVPAGLPFDLKLSADEVVHYLIRFGELELYETAQSYSISLLAAEGVNEIEVIASDTLNNESNYAFTVMGLPAPQPQLVLPASLIPGEPLSISVAPDSSKVAVTAASIRFAGTPQVSLKIGDKFVALASIPLGTKAQHLHLEVSLVDEYGRIAKTGRWLEVLPDPREIEELNLSAATLQVVTPEGRELERQTMATAYAAMTEQVLPLWTEPFLLPIEGRSSSGFGLPRRYAAGGNVTHHYGTDIAAPIGTPIVATNVGLVRVADFFPIKGGFIVIDHGAGLYSFYLHQSNLLVKVGDRVVRGQVIGEVGSTGLSTGPHLHWEMRLNAVPTNPLSWVGKTLP